MCFHKAEFTNKTCWINEEQKQRRVHKVGTNNDDNNTKLVIKKENKWWMKKRIINNNNNWNDMDGNNND